jgi:hypothetical protein
VLSSAPGNAKPILRTESKLIVLLGMASAIIRKNIIAGTAHSNFAYSALACFSMGMSGSASLQKRTRPA